MNAAFCCASLGIVPTVRHADYIGSWLEVLREDNRAIVRAASQASKAADWLLGFLPARRPRSRARDRPEGGMILLTRTCASACSPTAASATSDHIPVVEVLQPARRRRLARHRTGRGWRHPVRPGRSRRSGAWLVQPRRDAVGPAAVRHGHRARPRCSRGLSRSRSGRRRRGGPAASGRRSACSTLAYRAQRYRRVKCSGAPPGRRRSREEEGCAGLRDGLEVEREALGRPSRRLPTMATAVQKITLSSSRDIPFNKLVLSQSNVRRVKAGVSIEELAEDIARRDAAAEPATSGRSSTPTATRPACSRSPPAVAAIRALELLVKQKRLAKTAPVPCVVRDPVDRYSGRGRLAGREHPARAAASARSVPRLPGPAREGAIRGGHRRRLLHLGERREAASAARVRLAGAARRLRRGRHDARAAHGLHRHLRSRPPGAGLGSDLQAPGRRSPIRSAAC